MAYTCENCGRPVLETDTVCWHCGWKQPKRRAEEKPTEAEEAPELTPTQFSALTLYGVLTAVIIVAALLVMGSLGRYPVVAISAETGRSLAWTPVTDETRSFTLDLPADWLLFQKGNEPEALADLLAADDRYRTAVDPLDPLLPDNEIILVTIHNDPPEEAAEPAYLVLSRSPRLNRLTPQQVIEFVAENDDDENIIRADVTENLVGQPQVEFLIRAFADGVEMRCLQQVTPGEDAAYILSGCAPTQDIRFYDDDFEDILTSFQPLMW